MDDTVGDPVGFVGFGAQPCHLYFAWCRRNDWDQRVEAAWSMDLGADPVGEIEDDPIRSAVLGERKRRSRLAVSGGEMVGEPFEVLQRSAPPFVDGLIGVPDGGDREAVTKYRNHEQALGRIGILILIEQHRPIPIPDAPGELRILGDHPVGETDQVGVVDHPDAVFRLGIGLRHRGQFESLFPYGIKRVGRRGSEVGCGEQVVAELPGQGSGLVDPVRRSGEIERVIIPCDETLFEELALEAGSDDIGTTLHPNQGTELLKDPVGKAVVGGHLDLAPGRGQLGELSPQVIGQLLGGLVGERDAERLFWVDSAFDESGEAEHDRRGLSRARPGRDPKRLERMDHDCPLLGCEGHAPPANASLPSGRAGQTDRTGHFGQPRFGCGSQRSLRMPWATARMRSSTSGRRSTSNGRTVIPLFRMASGYHSSA